MGIITKLYCDKCNTELQWTTENKISEKISECVRKDSPLSYKPQEIYEFIEGDEYDFITYDYIEVYSKYICPTCKIEVR